MGRDTQLPRRWVRSCLGGTLAILAASAVGPRFDKVHRLRILLLLDGHELTVTELCGITQLPQSTVSRHLKALADSGWVSVRSEGPSHLYTISREHLDSAARRLWQLVREQVGSGAAASQD